MEELKLFEFNMSKLSFDERVPYLVKIFSLPDQDEDHSEYSINRNEFKSPKYDTISFGVSNYRVKALYPYNKVFPFSMFSPGIRVRPLLVEFFEGIKGLYENEKVEYIPTRDNFKWHHLLEYIAAERIIGLRDLNVLSVKQMMILYSALAEYIFGIKTPRAEIIEQNMSSAKKRIDKSELISVPDIYLDPSMNYFNNILDATEYAILKHENLLTEGCFLHPENEYLNDIPERAYKKALHTAMVEIYENVPIKFRE